MTTHKSHWINTREAGFPDWRSAHSLSREVPLRDNVVHRRPGRETGTAEYEQQGKEQGPKRLHGDWWGCNSDSPGSTHSLPPKDFYRLQFALFYIET